MKTTAIIRNVHVSARKGKLVVDLIRGKKVNEALTILNNTNNKAARKVVKVLNSAIANAVNNFEADINTLYVKEARVDAGPVMKRVLFDSRGRIGHKDKRTSHIVITVASK